MLSIQESKWTCESVRYTLTMMTAAQLTCVCMIHCDHDDCCTAYMCLYDTLWQTHDDCCTAYMCRYDTHCDHDDCCTADHTCVSTIHTVTMMTAAQLTCVGTIHTVTMMTAAQLTCVSVWYTVTMMTAAQLTCVCTIHTVTMMTAAQLACVCTIHTVTMMTAAQLTCVCTIHTVTMMTAAQLTCVCTIHCDHDDCCTAYMCLYDTLWPWWLLHSLHVSVCRLCFHTIPDNETDESVSQCPQWTGHQLWVLPIPNSWFCRWQGKFIFQILPSDPPLVLADLSLPKNYTPVFQYHWFILKFEFSLYTVIVVDIMFPCVVQTDWGIQCWDVL